MQERLPPGRRDFRIVSSRDDAPVRSYGPGSLSGLLLTIALAAVFGWLVRSFIDQPQSPRLVTVDRLPSSPPTTPELTQAPRPTGARCSYPDGKINDWPGGPIDYFHFLPRCDEGGRR